MSSLVSDTRREIERLRSMASTWRQGAPQRGAELATTDGGLIAKTKEARHYSRLKSWSLQRVLINCCRWRIQVPRGFSPEHKALLRRVVPKLDAKLRWPTG